jgi:hypothetical protein
MPKKHRITFGQHKTTASGTLNEELRTVACAKYVNENMKFAVSKLYIKNYFDKVARAEVLFI